MRKGSTAALLAVHRGGRVPAAQTRQTGFDGGRAYEDLRQIVAIGPRPAGSAGAESTRTYIRQQLAHGLKPQDQSFVAQTPVGAVKMTNLRVTIPGAGPGRLVIGGHYDTKLFRNFSFVGANDGGSSTAFLIELGRVLKARKNAVTVELLFLDGEESTGEWQGTDHTYGSRYYVDAARKDGTLKDIRAFILVDMIGDRELLLKRESRSTPWLTEFIWSTAKRLNRPEFSDESTPIEDDHLNFLEAGVPAVDLIDLEYYTRSGSVAWHTREDTLDNVTPDRSKPSRRPAVGPAGDREEARPSSAAYERCTSSASRISSSVEHRRRRLGPGKDPVDLLVAHRQPAPLEPEHHVRSPDIGPTSISCSRPTMPAGTPEYTASTSSWSFLRNALITAAACTPVAVRNASRPTTG